MVLIKVLKSGRSARQCDARCYDAQELECACVCGGANHGRGIKQAKVNTELAGHLLARNFIEREQLEGARVQIGTWEKKQIPLFDTLPMPRPPRRRAVDRVH